MKASEISLAASKIEGLTYTPTSNLGLIGQKINYLGKLSFQTNVKTVYPPAHFFIYGLILRRYSRPYTHGGFYTQYEFLEQVMDDRLSDSLEYKFCIII